MAKCIVVDDSKFMRKIIIDALIEENYEIVAEAENGSEAIEFFNKFKPDFMTMDMTMAGTGGATAVVEIKKIDPNSKIIVVSALSEETLKMKNPDINADAFLTKPFDKDDLIKAVEKVLGS